MERLESVGYKPSIGRFRDEQIAHRSTWTSVPDDQVSVAAMTRIHVVPSNGSTVTYVNPMDPANEVEGQQRLVDWSETSGNVLPAGRVL